MKTKMNVLIALMGLLFFAPLHLHAGYNLRSYELQINGGSNLQSWSAAVNGVRTTGDIVITDGVLKELRDLVVEIDVASIEGSEGNTMTKKIMEAFDEKRHPVIRFQLSQVVNIERDSDDYLVTARGNLTMAGSTRPIQMQVRATIYPNGDIAFSGMEQFLMTRWNIDPPRALFGALRTRDEVEVAYQVVLTAE